nr:hypothetical protein [Tanacetum cinerariifolium]
MHCSFLYIVSCVMIDHYVTLSSFRHCRGVTVKEKNQVSDNVVAKDVVVPNVVDEPILSSMGGPMAQRVTVTGNSSRTHDSSTATLVVDGLSLVANYVQNTWSKYGLVKSMLNSNDGLDAMLENGPWCSSCKLFGHILDDFPNNIVSDVEKNLKNPKQAARGVQVGRKVDFKPLKQVYRPVSNRNNDSSSVKKKQVVVASNEVSHSNQFDVFNLVEKDNELGYIYENVDSDSEVKDVVDDPAVFISSTGLKRGSDSGYGINSLLEQWMTTKQDDDDNDPYDDDLYESHDMSVNPKPSGYL